MDVPRHPTYNTAMSQELHAIYEHGILRPLAPLDLPEATEVTLTLRETSSPAVQPARNDPLLDPMCDEPERLDKVIISNGGKSSSCLQSGAELVAYWQQAGLVGARDHIANSQQRARQIRAEAERRQRS